jgi:hypothetical protein
MIANMISTRLPSASLLALVSVLALSGCFTVTPVSDTASSTPTPTASEASPTPTASAGGVTPEPAPAPAPAPAVAADKVVISAVDIKVFDAAVNTLATIPYTGDPIAAANELTATLGETPTITTIVQTNCRRAGSEYAWGGLVLVTAGTITSAPGAVFSISTTSATTGGGVDVKTTNGWYVGVPLANIVAALPSAPKDDGGGGFARIELEHLGGSGADTTGVLAVAQSGTVTTIASPVYTFGDC